MSDIETEPTAPKAKRTKAKGDKTRPLSVQGRLEYAHASVAVLRTLEILDATMRVEELAKAIGLIAEGGGQKAWHRAQIKQILAIVSASEKQGNGDGALKLERILGKDGVPVPRKGAKKRSQAASI